MDEGPGDKTKTRTEPGVESARLAGRPLRTLAGETMRDV